MFRKILNSLKNTAARAALVVGLASAGTAALGADIDPAQIDVDGNGVVTVMDSESNQNRISIRSDVLHLNAETGEARLEINPGTRGLEYVARKLGEMGIDTTVEAIADANGITDPNIIHVTPDNEIGLIIPGVKVASSQVDPAVAQTVQTASLTIGDASVATIDPYEMFAKFVSPTLQFSGFETKSADPFARWTNTDMGAAVMVAADNTSAIEISDLGRELLMNAVARSQDNTYSTLLLNVDLPVEETATPEASVAEVPEAQGAEAAPAVAEMTDDERRIFLTSTPSDEELRDAPEDLQMEKMVGTIASYSEEHLPYLLAGYKLAIDMGNQTNIENYTGEMIDYDGMLSAIPDEMVAAEIKTRNPDFTDDQVIRAVQGFQAGAQNMIANDEPCDDLTETFFINSANVILSQQPEVVRDALASVAWSSYDRGADEVECVDCGEETSIRPMPRPEIPVETPKETYTATPGASLCSDVARGLDKSFEEVVRENNLRAPYLLDLGQVLDLTNVGELDEENDELFEQYCTGTGPLPPVSVVPHNPGVPSTPVTPNIPTVVGGCEILHSRPLGVDTYTLISLSSEFRGLCGCSGEVFDRNFGPNGEPLWGDRRQQCPRDNDNDPDPISVPVEQPGGGCQSDCGGGDPNDDLGGGHPPTGGGNTPPGPNPAP